MEKIIIKEIIGCLLVILSYGLTISIFGEVINKRRSKKEMVYYLSKIATVKNIVKVNHQSQIFNDFNDEGNLEGININYQRLLELLKDGECKKGYKKCGILDTIGNILCIDESFGCPINQINVDLRTERNKYLKKGSKEIYNENLIYNYQFYYSNKSIDNNITVCVLFSQSNPKYITISNFVIDTEAYEDILGDLPSINEENEQKNNLDKGIQDLIIGIASNSEPLTGNVLRVVFSLLSFSSNKYMPNEKMENFKKYVEKRIKEKENKIDKYFTNIGENAYIKNYIGFQSLENIETFMNFDYKKRYKNIFPSRKVFVVSIIFLILNCIFLGLQIYIYIIIEKIFGKLVIKENYSEDNSKIAVIVEQNNDINEPRLRVNNNQLEETKNNIEKKKYSNENIYKYPNDTNTAINKEDNNRDKKKTEINDVKCLIVWESLLTILIILTNLWIFLCAYKRYSNISKKFIDLKRIKSDDFINNFISEFIEICSKKNTVYYEAIIIPVISIFFHLAGYILLIIVICQKLNKIK